MSTTAEDLKIEGQTRSVSGLTDAMVDAFLSTVSRVPHGERISVNDLRPTLDEHGIPNRSRGGLFALAVSEGLLVPMEVQVGGRTYPVRIPSTGASAHAATVRVYERRDGALW